jgi:Zn finger protein HypA/HybF involved in hydrogenase expression
MDTIDSSPVEEDGRSWSEAAGEALRRRWVQVALASVLGALSVGISAAVLAPKKTPKPLEPAFIFCPKCEFEARYDPKLDGEECPHCSAEPLGHLEGREKSIKEVGTKSRWRWFHLAASIELLLTLGTVVYLLYRPLPDPSNTYYVFSCQHCYQRLRFRHLSLGALGQCSRCKRLVRFPTERDAVKEEDLMREEAERMAAETDDGEDEE